MPPPSASPRWTPRNCSSAFSSDTPLQADIAQVHNGVGSVVYLMLFSFMVLFFDDSNVLVESEDGTGKEERLGDVVEQAGGDVVDVDHLVADECDAADDE